MGRIALNINPRLGALALAALLLNACGGGGGGYGSSNPPPVVMNASPGGVWMGTDSVTNLPMTGLITEAGVAHFLRSDGVQYYGTVVVSGNSVSGRFTGVTEFGTTFPDGSTSGTGTITGTVTERSALTIAATFTTSLGTATTASVMFTYNSIYAQASSLATIAGNYSTPDGAVVTVSSGGVVFSQDPTTSCVINGTVSVIDATYNAYDVSYTFSSCAGAAATLNGTTATGLGALDTATNPVTAIIGVTNSTAGYSLVESLPKM